MAIDASVVINIMWYRIWGAHSGKDS